MKADRMHCHLELEKDLQYEDLLPDDTLFRWFHDQYSTSKHLLTLYSIAKSLRARRIVEVGFGRSSFVLARAAYENRGFFTTCDTRDFRSLLNETEKRVTTYIHGDSTKLWPNVRSGIDLAFLDYFSSEVIEADFVQEEISRCASKLKRNGLILIHDTLDARFKVGDTLHKIAGELELEHAILPYNYGLSILRRTTPSEFGTIYDMNWKRRDTKADSSDIKVFIPSDLKEQLTGGPRTFMNNICSGLKSAGYSFISEESNVNEAESIFFPIKYDIQKLEQWKSQGKKIIQRLDGVYYPSQHGEAYKERNADIEHIYKNLVDIVVFQSGFSRDLCFEVMGEHGASRECIIYNGAPNSFEANNRNLTQRKAPFRAVTAGHIRHPAMIQPLIEVVEALQGELQLTVIGKIEPELQDYVEHANVIHIPPIHHEELATTLQSHDFLLYTVLNPNCPNIVVEANALGMPVVSFNSGSMRELCMHNFELLAWVNDDIIHTTEDFNSDHLLEKVSECMRQYEKYVRQAQESACSFTLQEMVETYASLFIAAEKL